jgi:hypothetical protein
MADLGRCSVCGTGGTGIMLDGRPYCDRCADRRLAAITGWPTLPDPPPPEVIVGPDGRHHFIRYRLLRMPGAVVALADELGVPAGSGHRLEVHGNHFGDPASLLPRIQAQVRAAIAHPYLEPNEWGHRDVRGSELGGRLEEDGADDDAGGPRVVVDGYSLSWAELGDLLRPYVGWTLELRLGSELPLREGDTSGKISVRPPTTKELRAAARALRESAGAYVLDSAHFPTRDQWARGLQG